MNSNLEQRTLLPGLNQFATRAEGEDLYIEGYFAVFNSSYPVFDGVEEQIAPGAFSDTLGGDIRALINHDPRLVMGRTKSGTLTLREDARGLWGSIRINQQDVDAMNQYRRSQRGDVDQGSFGFYIEAETREVLEDGTVRYTITKVRLLEVSVVTFPAYEETSVSARGRQEAAIRERELSEWRVATLKKLKGE